MNDDSERIKQEIKRQEPTFLSLARKKVHNRPTYICPWCGNGSGQDGTGIEYSERNGQPHYICHKCNRGGDVITLWQASHPGQGYMEAIKELGDFYHIDTGSYSRNWTKNAAPAAQPQGTTTPTEKPPTNYTSYYRTCHKRLMSAAGQQGRDYLASRGIGTDTINRYNLGMDPHYKASESAVTEMSVITIPTSDFTFCARNINSTNTEGRGRYYKTPGPWTMFNVKSVWESDKPVAVVEGEVDALSMYEAGVEAVGLGGVGDWKKLIKILEAARPNVPIIIALDNDKAGKENAAALARELDRLEVDYWPTINPDPESDEAKEYNPGAILFQEGKDANDGIRTDRDAFTKRMAAASREAQAIMDRRKEKERQEYIKSHSIGAYLPEFERLIEENRPPIPTGYKLLDKALDGGLFEGLYVVGALTSLGKTTFVLQMADQVARTGTDVLIFALEMSKAQLIGRSISRITYQNTGKEHGRSCRDILQGERWPRFGEAGMDAIGAAEDEYREFADHIFITESTGRTTAAEVAAQVKNHIAITGHKPLVIVDYLQILGDADPRAGDKANTDEKVLTLKQLSRDCGIPVIAVSSINRASYNDEITLEAMKESGGIDFGSDIVIGLQLEGAGTPDFDALTEKEKPVRKVEAVILKSREGVAGLVVKFNYYAKYNHYQEQKNGLYRKSTLKRQQQIEREGEKGL